MGGGGVYRIRPDTWSSSQLHRGWPCFLLCLKYPAHRLIKQTTASTIRSGFKETNEAYKDATKILKKNDVELERLAQGLLEYETLDGNEIKIIVDGGTLVRKDAEDTPINQKPKRKSRTGLPGTGRPKKPGSEPA